MSRARDLEHGAVHVSSDDGSGSRGFTEGGSEGRKGYRTTVSSGSAAESNTIRRRRTTLHCDAFGREPGTALKLASEHDALHDDSNEVFLDPVDGRLRVLKVQSRSTSQEQQKWQLVKLKAASRPHLQSIVDWNFRNRVTAICFYIPSVFATAILLFNFAQIEIKADNNGKYDPILYRNWKSAGAVRSTEANRTASGHADAIFDEKYVSEKQPVTSYQPTSTTSRALPQYLIFVDDLDLQTLGPNDEVAREVTADVPEEYVYVSYSRAQFSTNDQDRASAFQNRLALLTVGINAARAAGVKAFWLGCYPLANPQEDVEDMSTICDIVRNAHSLCIALNSSRSLSTALHVWSSRLSALPEVLLSSPSHPITIYDSTGVNAQTYDKRKLGSIAWSGSDWSDFKQLLDHSQGAVCLPQLELANVANRSLRRRRSSSQYQGDVAYALMGLLRRRPQVVRADSDFAAFARLSLASNSDAIVERLLCMQPAQKASSWHDMTDAWGASIQDIEPTCRVTEVDSTPSSQIVTLDGVHGASINWSKLEPVAFFTRSSRMRRLTMILLPKAPYILLIGALLTAILVGGIQSVKQTSNEITSVANSLLAFPASSTATQTLPSVYSYTTTDIFGTQTLQGITTNIITTTITPTTTFTPTSTALSNIPSLSEVTHQSLGALGFFLTYSCQLLGGGLLALLAGPLLLRNLYRAKFHSTQARFFGVQGHVDLRTLERHLFGRDIGLLHWSTATSLQSRAQPVGISSSGSSSSTTSNGDIYEGIDPNSSRGAAGTSLALPARDADGRTLFTLVDTFVLEASVFYAQHPPSAVLLCGREGGARRALLCSYDWRAQAFCREVVLRMKSVVLDRMARVDRVRVALGRS